jgi:ubiquinone/menaquinone biosynthesis C-methylase UbiE
MEPLVCPTCKSSLRQDNYALVCENCRRSYAIQDGVFNFLGEKDVCWGEVPPEYMKELVGLARRKGFKTALEQVAFQYPDLEDYLLSYGRIDWLFHCLNLQRNDSCLDLGSGWGSLTFALARHFKEVWSLEPVRQRIEFQKIRRDQEGTSNVNLARALMSDLPFSNGYFDLIVANGVLEWVGIGDNPRNPRRMQLDFLREIKRLLRPQGCLYIGIENRFGWPNFLGARDHSGLPFSSILPRKLADLEVKILRRTKGVYQREKRTALDWKSYRTYTYSSIGYRDLLKEAGFDDIDLFWVSPSYNYPMFSARLDDIRSFMFFLKNAKQTLGYNQNSTKKLLMMLASYLPHSLMNITLPMLWPDFLIFAYKGRKNASFESMLLEFGDKSFLRMSGSGGLESGINYFLFRDDEPRSIVRFPRFKEGSQRLENKEVLFERFNKVRVRERDVSGVRTFIEPMLKGKPFEIYNPFHNQVCLKWLIAFQNDTKKGFWNFEEMEQEVKNLSSYVSEIRISREIRLRTSERLEHLLKHLEGLKIEKTSEHGDFWAKNILIDDNGKIYVIDWEYYKEEGNPLFDFCFFIITNCMTGLQPQKSFYENFSGKGKYTPILRNLLADFSKKRNLTPELIFSSVPYVLLRFIRRHSNEFENWDTARATFIKLLETWDEVTSL